MSMYDTFMASTQAITAINARRTAFAVDALLEHQRTHDAEESARRQREAGLKQVVFEGAKIADEARRVLPASPSAALYLALRAAPIFGPAGVKDADLPELRDKAFHHEATRAWREVESSAREALYGTSVVAEVERIIWLENVIPLIRTYAAWAATASLLSGWNASIAAEDESSSGLLGSVVVLFLGGSLAFYLVKFVSTNLAIIVNLLIWAVIPKLVIAHAKAPGIRKKAETYFQEAGEPLPRIVNEGLVKHEISARRRVLDVVPEVAALGSAELTAARAKEIAASLQSEHNALWQRVFSRLDERSSRLESLPSSPD